MSKSLYMHTLNDAPAEYCPETGKVYFAGSQVSRLAKSLDQIRSEQRDSKINGRDDFIFKHGYIRIKKAAALKHLVYSDI